MNDALISPEVYGDCFESRQIIPEICNHGILCMAYIMMLYNIPTCIQEKHALITGCTQNNRICIFEIFNYGNSICMFIKRLIVG